VHPKIQHVLKTFGQMLAVLVLGLALAVLPDAGLWPPRSGKAKSAGRTPGQKCKPRPAHG
jgi:hypothetical protein